LDNEKTVTLQREIALYHSIINHANVVIGAKDLDGRYIFVNKEYSRLFEVDQHEFIGQTDFDLFPHEFAASFRENDKNVIAKNHSITLEEKVMVSGGIRYYLSVKFPVHDEEGILFATGLVATDITERKKAEDKTYAHFYKVAHTDDLTQIHNRAYFNHQFDNLLTLAKRENKKLALLLIDLDDFKPVNDSYGHLVGDELLKKAAQIFKKSCRETDIVARLGGDEFAIILVSPDNKKTIDLLAKKIIDKINKPILISKHNIKISSSIGIAIFPEDDKDKDKLINKADLALYEAKKSGRNTLKFYNPKTSAPLRSG